MFEIGEGVVHPVRGTGVITDISCQSVSGEPRKYYAIDMVAGDMKLLVPVESAEEIGLRRVMGPVKAKRLLGVVSAQAESLPTDSKERTMMLTSILSGKDILRKAAALRDLAWRRHRKGLSGGDGRVFERLKYLLSGEIALAVGMSFDEARVLLEKLMRRSFSETGMQATCR